MIDHKAKLLLVGSIVLFSALPLWGDDTSMFQSGRGVRPNVMIVMDTSGSMSDGFYTTYSVNDHNLVALALFNASEGTSYGTNTNYYSPALPLGSSNDADENVVYLRGDLINWLGLVREGGNYYEWSKFSTSPVSSVSCAAAKSDLAAKGVWSGRINDDGTCASHGRERTLATANYIAMLCMTKQPKIKIAKSIMKDIVRSLLVRYDRQNNRLDPIANIGIMSLNEEIGYDPDENYVNPSNPLPVTQSVYPSGTSHDNMEQVMLWNFIPFGSQKLSDLEDGLDWVLGHQSADGVRNVFRTDGHWWGTLSVLSGVTRCYSGVTYYDTKNYQYYRTLFSDDDGGRVVVPIKYLTRANTAAIDTHLVNAQKAIGLMQAEGQTPLAEALSEAALYLSGTRQHPQKSWAMPDTYYPRPANYSPNRDHYAAYRITGEVASDSTLESSSPLEPAMAFRCQPNYIVVVSDGEPNNDEGTRFGKSLFGGSDYSYFNESSKLKPDYLSSVTWNTTADRNFLWPLISGINAAADPTTLDKDFNCKLISTIRNQTRLDEVANWLYTHDLVSTTDSYDDTGTANFGTMTFNDYLSVMSNSKSSEAQKMDARSRFQNARVFTIGLDTKWWFLHTGSNLNALADTARAGHGRYYQANSATELEDAFNQILERIFTDAYDYAACAVPSSGSSDYYSGRAVYVPMFLPSNTGIWRGNIKKYALYPDGTLHDTKGNLALGADGKLLKSATDFWSATTSDDVDYSQVDTGGLGSRLAAQAQRNWYAVKTTTAGDPVSIDTLTDKDFDIDTDPEVISKDYTRADLLATIKKTGDSWKLGDIMHSSPATMNMPSALKTKTAIFVGSNDGFLHCFVDTHDEDDTWKYDSSRNPVINNQNHLIEEMWAVAPNDVIKKLKYLAEHFRSGSNDTSHRYYVDGSPVIYKFRNNGGAANTYSYGEIKYPDKYDNQTYLVCGLRRGGTQYMVLDLLSSDGLALSTPPRSAFTISDGTFPSGHIGLGNSWGVPQVGLVKDNTVTASNSSNPVYNYKKLLFFAGGYDLSSTINEDTIDAKDESAGDNRLKGSFAYAVNAASGDLFAEFSSSLMRDSIVDLAVFDKNYNGSVDTLYAPDLGGKLWRFAADENGTANSWVCKLVLNVSTGRYPRKFFNAPDVVLEPGYEYLFIGTGDREHPENLNGSLKTVDSKPTVDISAEDQDCFYAIKYRRQVNNLTQSDLKDITTANYATESAIIKSWPGGWYLRLAAPGEKVVNKAVTINGVVFFTTYQPPLDATATDICATRGNDGISRLYAINYKNGNYYYDSFANDTDPVYDSDSLADRRSMILGNGGMPAQPSLVVTDKSVSLVVGAKAVSLDLPSVATAYYWRYL